MTIQKVISAPSAKSQIRGRKGMASLDRKAHYLASEHERESCAMYGQDGQEITPAEAIERMGGKQAAYVEIVSDASVLETKALLARHPDREPRDVMRDHFVRQHARLDKSGNGIVALHQEKDGSWHAHLLLPGERDSYKRLDGPHGLAKKAWSEAWRQEQDRRTIDHQERLRGEKIQTEMEELRKEIKAHQKSGKRIYTEPDQEKRLSLRETFSNRSAELEQRLHEATVRRASARFRSRGQEGGLEHLVELSDERDRHVAATRRIEMERLGVSVQASRRLDPTEVQSHFARIRAGIRRAVHGEDRKSFRELNLDQKSEVRRNALERELEALVAKQSYERSGAGGDPELMLQKHESEVRAALLRNRIGLLRDQEGEMRGGLAKSLTTSKSRWNLMAERHGLERDAFHADAKSRGRTPSPEAVKKLSDRQFAEKRALTLEAGSKLAGKVRHKAVGATRKVVAAPSRAMKKLSDRAKQASRGGAKGDHAHSKEADHLENAAQGTLATAGAAATKTAVTAVVETAKIAKNQAKHLAVGIGVTAQAIAAGVVNPAVGAKIASEGYSRVGSEALRDGAKDATAATKEVGKDAATGARDTSSQALNGVMSLGTNALPVEAKAAVGVAKETVKAGITSAFSLVRGDVLGAATSAGQGAMSVAGEAAQGLKGNIGPFKKPLDLAGKIPIVGIPFKGIKLLAELSAGGVNVSKKAGMDIDL